MTTRIRHQDGVVILEPAGKIVGNGVSELRASILPEIAAYEEPQILINFEHVKQINSSGLGILIQARNLVKRKNGRIAVIHVGKHIKTSSS